MNTPSQSHIPLRQALLDQIAAITTMRPGSLCEDYREHPAADGCGTVRLGPYYKHQIWQDGRNVSRRVPAAEAATLKLDIDNAKLFDRLTGQLAQFNIQHTIALRAGQAAAADTAEKKPSRPNASRKNTAKPKASSPKPAGNSSKRKRASKH